MKKKTKIILAIIPVVLLLGMTIGGLIFLNQSYDPMPVALDALESDNDLSVSNERNWIIFEPTTDNFTTGFIFYPGGNVEPEAYAILARSIALEGFLVSIIKMPFDLAFFAPNKGLDFLALYPEIISWFIGGHSLGGSMAARVVFNNEDTFDGLVLLASYPAKNNNLSSYSIEAVSIYGTLDGVLSQNIIETLSLLPSTTTVIEINGGNHAYFGYYGEQRGDNPAEITREEQHQDTKDAIIDLLM